MSDNRHLDPFILSSSCPYSCSLVEFAVRLGATIDPDFLLQCQVADPKLQTKIETLKATPWSYETPLSMFSNQDDVYLDMDASDTASFFDSWQFQEYNAWYDTPAQWDSISAPTDDLLIEFI
jgi:hypothetical protein